MRSKSDKKYLKYIQKENVTYLYTLKMDNKVIPFIKE